jgi:hypothetical protein
MLMSSQEELVTATTCEYDSHNFRSDVDIVPVASWCC